MRLRRHLWITLPLLLTAPVPTDAQEVTFRPYIQPGDNGPFGATDQMVVAWQTDEATPSVGSYAVQFGLSLDDLDSAPVSARVVDNYLSADAQFASLTLPFKYGAHSDYTAVLKGLDYQTNYYYK